MEKQHELQQIEVSKINFNENNPRGESEEKITTDPQFKQLISSINEFGILMPLILKKTGFDYLLIDGERRLRASKVSGIEKVPAHVVDSDVNGRILAYQVHMLRKDWSKITEVKSLKIIIKDIVGSNPEISEIDLKRQIKEITNAQDDRISDWIILLKYDDDIVEKVTNGIFPMSHLIQNENSFLNKIKALYPNILNTFSEDKIRNILARKAEKKLMGNTRFLMDTFKNVFNCESHREEIEILLFHFIEQQDINIHKTYEEFENIITPPPLPTPPNQPGKEPDTSESQEPQKGIQVGDNTGKKKPSQLTTPVKGSRKDETSKEKPDLNAYRQISLTKTQETKIKDIRPKFETIGKTFSDEELEYIKEAITCLDNFCYKAAILMIWSSGISRILQYIEKNLPDYNTSCSTMKSNPTSVYKYYAKTFQTSAANIEEIRQASLDMQLISYMCFKKFISEPDFKKLKGHYDTRCDCAHPTKITITPNEIISIFENVYRLVHTNQNLK